MSEDTPRPVIIDGANAARMYLDHRRGDAYGPIGAYKFCKMNGHEYVKIYIKSYRVKGDQEGVMFNVEEFIEEIPESDIVLIPVDLDDDSFFIRDAIEKNAILITNDLLRDHQRSLSGRELSRFDKWIQGSRCGFTFVDDDFSPDPKFADFQYQPPAVDDEGEETRDEKKMTNFKALRLELRNSIMEELAPVSMDDLQSRLTDEEHQESRHREDRDEMNLAVREALDLRNELNAEVKKKIADVSAFKRMRDKHNSIVKEEKQNRIGLDRRLKDARNQTKPDKSKVRELEKSQAKAHARVEKEATKAQAAQDSMEEENLVVADLRAKANDAHQDLTSNKRAADDFHQSHTHSMTVIYAINGIIKNRKREEKRLASRVHIDAAMAKISRHSTADLRRMLIDTITSQEEWKILLHSETLTKDIERILIKLQDSSAWTSSPAVQIQLITAHNTARYIIGRRGANIKRTRERMAAELDVDLNYFQISVLTPKKSKHGLRYEELFNDFTVEELKGFATQLGLKKGGNKGVLIERLIRGAFLQSVD